MKILMFGFFLLISGKSFAVVSENVKMVNLTRDLFHDGTAVELLTDSDSFNCYQWSAYAESTYSNYNTDLLVLTQSADEDKFINSGSLRNMFPLWIRNAEGNYFSIRKGSVPSLLEMTVADGYLIIEHSIDPDYAKLKGYTAFLNPISINAQNKGYRVASYYQCRWDLFAH